MLVPVITQVMVSIPTALTFDELHEKVVAMVGRCELIDLYDALELMSDSGLVTLYRDELHDITGVQWGHDHGVPVRG